MSRSHEVTQELENISIALDKISSDIYYLLQSYAHLNPLQSFYAMTFRKLVSLPLQEQLAKVQNLEDKAFEKAFGPGLVA